MPPLCASRSANRHQKESQSVENVLAQLEYLKPQAPGRDPRTLIPGNAFPALLKNLRKNGETSPIPTQTGSSSASVGRRAMGTPSIRSHRHAFASPWRRHLLLIRREIQNTHALTLVQPLQQNHNAVLKSDCVPKSVFDGRNLSKNRLPGLLHKAACCSCAGMSLISTRAPGGMQTVRIGVFAGRKKFWSLARNPLFPALFNSAALRTSNAAASPIDFASNLWTTSSSPETARRLGNAISE